MTAYLRSAHAELIAVPPPPAAAAFIFGGALAAAPARSPVTTRDVAAGEVLGEMTCVCSRPKPVSPLVTPYTSHTHATPVAGLRHSFLLPFAQRH